MIKLICVGKIKEKYLNDAIDEYKKRLSKYTKLDIIELKDITYDDIDKVKNTLIENSVEYKGIYKITRLENGSKKVENID